MDFFNHLNMLYGTVTEFCTPQEVCHPCRTVERWAQLSCDNLSARSCLQDQGEPYHPTRYRLGETLLTFRAPGRRYEYLWEDGVRYKKATKLPAPEYVDALMNWAQGLLDNEETFPSEMGMSRNR